MISSPTNWDALWPMHDTSMELRFRVYNNDAETEVLEYSLDDMLSSDCKLTHYLYDSYSIGNACIGRLTVTLFTDAVIASGIRRCTLECRLVNGDTATDWVPQGTYYINSIERNDGDSLKITAYDPMALLDQDMYEGGTPPYGTYPASAAGIVAQICAKAGIGYPDDDSGFASVTIPSADYMSCREILQDLGTAAGGNWTVTKDCKLKFVPLGDLRTARSVCVLSVADISETSETEAVSAVSITGGESDHRASTSGDGIEIEGVCTYGTKAMTTALMSKLRGRTYHGVKLGGVYASPLVELGDCVSVVDNGTTVKLFADDMSVLYEQGMWGDVSSPLTAAIEQRIKFTRASKLGSNIKRAVESGGYLWHESRGDLSDSSGQAFSILAPIKKSEIDDPPGLADAYTRPFFDDLPMALVEVLQRPNTQSTATRGGTMIVRTGNRADVDLEGMLDMHGGNLHFLAQRYSEVELNQDGTVSDEADQRDEMAIWWGAYNLTASGNQAIRFKADGLRLYGDVYLNDAQLGIGGYALPPATASTLGGVKVGDGIGVESDGTIYAQSAKVDGRNLWVTYDSVPGRLGSDGATIDYPIIGEWITSGYIPVGASYEYVMQMWWSGSDMYGQTGVVRAMAWAFYDSSKAFIAGSYGYSSGYYDDEHWLAKLIPPSGAAYVRVTALTGSRGRVKLEAGGTTGFTHAPEDIEALAAQGNVHPYFGGDRALWVISASGSDVTDLGGGWYRYTYDNSAGSSAKQSTFLLAASDAIDVEGGHLYTVMVEIADNLSTGAVEDYGNTSATASWVHSSVSDGQLVPIKSATSWQYAAEGVHRFPFLTRALASPTKLAMVALSAKAGCVADITFRVSCWPGLYCGGYAPSPLRFA